MIFCMGLEFEGMGGLGKGCRSAVGDGRLRKSCGTL
jgi:hypothetical protein